MIEAIQIDFVKEDKGWLSVFSISEDFPFRELL